MTRSPSPSPVLRHLHGASKALSHVGRPLRPGRIPLGRGLLDQGLMGRIVMGAHCSAQYVIAVGTRTQLTPSALFVLAQMSLLEAAQQRQPANGQGRVHGTLRQPTSPPVSPLLPGYHRETSLNQVEVP